MMRRVWNAMIEKRPALIMRAAGVANVIQGRISREIGLVLAMRRGS